MGTENKVAFTWVDNVTPLDAAHLNAMVKGINENYQDIGTKADATEIDKLRNEIPKDYINEAQMNAAVAKVTAKNYDSTSTYSIGDIVAYNGYLYRCTSNIATPEAFNPSHWEITTSVAEIKRETQWETIADTTISETVSQYTITTGGNYKKLLIRIEMTEDTSEATESGRIQLAIGSQTVWSDGSGWIGKTKSGSTTVNGTSNPKLILFDIDVAENYTMIRARGMWNRSTIDSMDVYTTPIYNPSGYYIGYCDWSNSSAVLRSGVTTNKITLYFRSTAYPLFAGSRVIVKGVQA